MLQIHWLRFRKNAKRAAFGLTMLSGIVVALGFVPGSFEGIYAGPQCMCDCSNFTLVRNGRVILYSSGHPPATMLGRYELSADGSAKIFIPPLKPHEPEKLAFRIKPKLFFAILEDVDKGASEWMWKRWNSAEVGQLIREQEIKVVTIPNEKEILSTYYDKDFRELRIESKPIKRPQTTQVIKGTEGG